MLLQIVSLIGAGLLLVAYLGAQQGWLPVHSRAFSALNLVGSGLLTWIAIVDRRWGFIVLEATWAIVSIPPLLRRPGGGAVGVPPKHSTAEEA